MKGLENLIKLAPVVFPVGQEARTKCQGRKHVDFLHRQLVFIQGGVFARWVQESHA